MATIRVARTAPTTLTHRFYVDETPTDSTSTVTVAITDATGAAVVSGAGTPVGPGLGYSYPLAGQPLVARLTATWTATIAGSTVVETDTIDVAGALFFSLAAGRASDPSLSSATAYPTSALRTALLEVEQECEHICDRAFVRRYARVALDGSGTDELLLMHPDPDRSARHVRTIRSASIATLTGGTLIPLTAGQLATLDIGVDGILRRTDLDVWTEGRGNVVVEYEYGREAPDAELVRAAMTRFRTRLNIGRSGIPDRAESYTAVDGGTYRLSMPGAYTTGIAEVDAVYERHSARPSGAGKAGTGGQSGPASRSLNFDPQWSSMFHGGVR
jgi:hypothetical protein